MKGLYLYYSKIDKTKMSGIDKKVVWQLEELNKNGLSCIMKIIKRKIDNERLFRFYFFRRSPKWIYSSEYDSIDFIYLRRPLIITKEMIKLFKNIKNRNNKVKIIVEIPTYPYDYELKLNLKHYILLIIDRINRRKFYKYVDRIAVQNQLDSIFGVPTLNFINGIKFSEISIRVPERTETINICAVASMEPWQGYERVINSLSEYYKNGGKRNVMIHFAGEGSELDFYKDLTIKSELNKRIKFHGFITGKELDMLYNKCDLALDAFGRYKTFNDISTSLKSREYLAKGLPVISGSNSDLFTASDLYYLQFTNDGSLFNFNEIFQFYDHIYKSKKSKTVISKEIRDASFMKCDLSVSMKEIIWYIKKI